MEKSMTTEDETTKCPDCNGAGQSYQLMANAANAAIQGAKEGQLGSEATSRPGSRASQQLRHFLSSR